MNEKKEPVILEIDLNNYPGLLNNPEIAPKLLKGHMELLSDALEAKHHEASECAFKQSYTDVLRDITEAMFNYKSLLAYHPNKGEAESMEILELENNPLSIFSGYSTPFDFNGNRLQPGEFIGPYSNFKTWLQSLLYASRYIPHYEYVKFVYLKEYDVLESLKHQNIEKLLMIKPALAYQQKNNLPVGKFLEETGFFDCGKQQVIADDGSCLACGSQNSKETNENIYCLDCKAGFTK